MFPRSLFEWNCWTLFYSDFITAARICSGKTSVQTCWCLLCLNSCTHVVFLSSHWELRFNGYTVWTRLHVLEFPALFSFLSRQHWLGDDGMCQQDGIQTRVTINIICRCVSWKIFESLLKSYARTQNGAAIKDQAARPRSVFSIATAFIKQSTSKVVRLAARGSWKLCGTSGLVPLNEYIYIYIYMYFLPCEFMFILIDIYIYMRYIHIICICSTF